jgi:carboxyl-terminal processing protease
MIKVMMTRTLGVLLATLALVVSAQAEEAQTPQPYVVLVGISDYKDSQIKARPHAEDDAKALYDLFTNKAYLGVDAAHTRLLLGKEDAQRKSQPATRANILEALKWLAKEAGPNDPVVFAFIGEGGPLGKSGDRRCYFAVDSTVKDRDKDAVAAMEIGEILKNLKSQRFCTFLDVDFKGFTGDSAALAEPTLGKAPYGEFLGDDDNGEEHQPLPGRVVFLATNGLSTSLDLEKHGLFTKVLLDGLKGAADKDGYEPDGVVTVEELTEYIDKTMPKLAQEFGKTKEEKQQQHFVLGGRGVHYVLTFNPEALPKSKERLEKFAQLVKDNKIPAKFVQEGQLYLSRMPKLEAQRKLRKEYQQLVDGTLNLADFETHRTAILKSTELKKADAEDYASKVLEAVQMIKEGYVKDVNPGEMVSWAIKGLYRRLDEKLPEQIEARLKDAKKLDEKDLKNLLADVRLQLGKREDLANHKDLDITLQRMLRNLDPYTTYIDPETKEAFDRDLKSFFTGIGIQIRKDTATDMLLVVTPIRNSPAHKAGLLAGDLISKVYRESDSISKEIPENERTFSTKGVPLSEAVKKILGDPGTKVKVTVLRDGVEKEFELTRDRITVETVHGYKRKDNADWDYMIDPERKIAYVRLSSFARNTAADLARVMNDLTRRGVKGVILDLRFNPGGLLDSAVKITDMFIESGLIVKIRPRVGKEYTFRSSRDGGLTDFPMVCMVNGFSASGSEIVSAALQDHHRAWIVGERSYGKGSVQNITPFEGGELKMTTATFWRPSGKNLNKSSTSGKEEEDWGVIPDKVVPLSAKEREELAEYQHSTEIIQRKDKPTEVKAFKDKQLEAALEYLRGQIKTVSRSPGR